MFRVAFPDTGKLKAFLSVNESDFIDVVYHGDAMLFITNTNEVFASLAVPAQTTDSNCDFSCRVYAKILSSITDDTVIEFSKKKDGTVEMRFMHVSGYLYYSCSFLKQVVFTTSYQDKIDLISAPPEGTEIQTDKFAEMIRVAKSSGTFISVDSGVAAVLLRGGQRIYKKIGGHGSFAITGTSMIALRKCNHTIFNTQNYLLAKLDNFCVLTKKVIAQPNDEYAILVSKEYKAKCIFEINLANVMKFLNTFSSEVTGVTIDVASQKCELETSYAKFYLNTEINNLRIADGMQPDELVIPTRILKNVFSQFRTTEFMVKQKKNYTQFEKGDFLVVW